MQGKKAAKQDTMHLIASGIVQGRYGILLIFLAAAVYCALSLGRVRVNSDLTAFLPPDTETRRGLTIMEEEFITYPSQSVMVANITYEQANRIVEIADKVDAVLNNGYNGRDKIGRNEAAFLRAFNSQLKIEFGMTWDGSAGEDFDNSTGLPFNIPDPFAPGFPVAI